MKNKFVDILVLNRNYASFLKDALKSCIGQTYRNINIIIADDNSTDASRGIIDQFHEKYTNVTKIFIDDNKPNIAKVRNILIQHAQSPFCCFLSSDDYFHEDFVKNSMKHLTTNPRAYGVYSNFNWISGRKKFLSTHVPPAFDDRESLHKVVTRPRNVVSFESSLFRSKIFKQNIYFKEDILHGEESLFICEVTQDFFFMKNPTDDVLAYKRKHSKQGHTEYLKDTSRFDGQLIKKIKEIPKGK